MKVYILGNPDLKEDNLACKIAEKFKGKINNLDFIIVNLNEDLPFVNEEKVIILDTINGINNIEIINDVDKFILSPRNSVHDFDLSYQLKYLKKLGKLKQISIIGLPQNIEVDYVLIQSILRKLVAQDMHGS